LNKLKYIDALRGVAVLLVVITHCGQFGTNDYGYILTTTISKAEYGVQLFFIISAFTLFLSFNYRSSKEKSPHINFFIRRFFRIAPMFYLAIFYYLTVNNTWLEKFSISPQGDILANLFFIHGLNPYWINKVVPGGWSVGIEVLFYLLIPLLFRFIKNINAAILFFLFSLIIQFTLNYYLIKHPLIPEGDIWQRFLYWYLPNQLPVFALGIILFQLLKGGEEHIKPVLIFLIFIILMIQFWFNIGFIPNFIFISIAFTILTYSLAKLPVVFLVNPIFTYLGKISYSVYLIHFAVLELMIKFGLSDILKDGNHNTINLLLRIGVALAISAIISSLTYYFIENIFIKLGNQLVKLLENK